MRKMTLGLLLFVLVAVGVCRPTFEVAEGGTRGIADERLPVQGYWLSACGMASADPLFGGCEDVADDLFEIGGPSALRETE
ncbi:MAG TPA: hypothetical protein VEZ72_12645 [Paenibacillus sp.]|nr:hypothetical protein [Paenibacillus sp.]